MRAVALLLLLACLGACGRVGPPVRSQPAAVEPELEAPQPDTAPPAAADEENPS